MKRTRWILVGCIAALGAALAGTAFSSTHAGPAGLILFHKEGGVFGEAIGSGGVLVTGSVVTVGDARRLLRPRERTT